MALFEGSHKSVLQGVSQQVARERQEGQVSAQLNMMSDPVTNLRRRPGAARRSSTTIEDASVDTILGWETDLGGYRRHVLLDTTTGTLRMLNEDYTLDQELAPNSYLVAPAARDIRWTTIGDDLILANTTIKPTKGAGATNNPKAAGFFFIKAGSLNRTYSITLSYGTGPTVVTATYSTPTGTGAGDAALSTPEYIAQQLVTGLTGAGRTVTRDGANVFIQAAANVEITSPTGDLYVITSGQAYVSVAANLPPKLPSVANDYIISTGSLSSPTYFKYVASSGAWLECGDYASPLTLTNMPVRVRRNTGDTAWEYDTSPYEGRFAGDDTSSPDPNFLTRGITGLSSFQGRLVILSGHRVNMSASNKPNRFYRSTVTSVLDSDPIEVGAQANSSAAYEYAVQFQKDLLLFSKKYQALVPALNTAITPRTASVVITSTFEADTGSTPITLGRTLMYPAPRSADFFGVMEMLPSPYTDSQYISNDVTVHLPKYMAGGCRFSVSSTVASMALFGPSGDTRQLIVHEYLWDGDNKIQQAWHQWQFPYPIATAYFSGSDIILLFVVGDQVVHATIDPRIGTITAAAEVRPYLDLYYFDDVVDREITLPAWLIALDANAKTKVLLSNSSDALAGEVVGVSDRSTNTLQTVRSFANGRVAVGFPFRSSMVPTVPMVKDSNGVKISSNKLSLLRYMITTRNSAEFKITVRDNASEGAVDPQSGPTLYWSSTELSLGMPRVNSESTTIVPCRTAADTTTVEIYTEGTQELNIIGLEYACRYSQKYRRR